MIETKRKQSSGCSLSSRRKERRMQVTVIEKREEMKRRNGTETNLPEREGRVGGEPVRKLKRLSKKPYLAPPSRHARQTLAALNMIGRQSPAYLRGGR